ncbi:MAG TPA: phosphomannomutase [Devosia sp.]
MVDALKFGTSGLRGPASELIGPATRRYTAAFLTHLKARGQSGSGRVFIGRDFRASSPAIAADCAAAIRAAGHVAVDCGTLPTPALALHAMAEGGPAIMITGSHIPADRNGLKFYSPAGEITKEDELGILGALEDAPPPDAAGEAEDGFPAAGDRYRRRYKGLLSADALTGWTVGVFEHSSVARDILASLLWRAGAHVVRIDRRAEFVAVDTEATSDAIYDARHDWIARHRLDAIVSTDGDGDRPLIIDGKGNFVRGDVLGILTAKFVGADTVVTPVTSNSAIESVGYFRNVVRTKVGSPYVIDGMVGAVGTVVGFEANGGVLLGSDVTVDGKALSRLPTRDAVLPILAVLGSAAAARTPLADLVAPLPVRPALSDRLTEVPTEKTSALVQRLVSEPDYAASYFSGVGDIESITTIDGPRFVLKGGDVIHYRPSGNAPELRCYVEAATSDRAAHLLRWGLDAAAKVVR